jgi:hypothetical protein
MTIQLKKFDIKSLFEDEDKIPNIMIITNILMERLYRRILTIYIFIKKIQSPLIYIFINI